MKRFAIYFAPPPGSSLCRLAEAWLGRASGEPRRGGLQEDLWRSATADPRVYGFHATLKPPFRLKPEVCAADLLEDVRSFAQRQHAFLAPRLEVSLLSSFLALTLSQPSPEFEALAGDAVRELDAYRMAPSAEEMARRRKTKLNARQLAYIDQWGYPYVMEEWRFHMTLTGSIEQPLRDSVWDHLKSLFASHCREPLLVDSICVFEQPGPGELFHVAERFPLS